MVALSAACAGALFLAVSGASAQTASPATQVAQASPAADAPAPRRRVTRRVPVYPRYQNNPDDVYPRYNPGPNAVRECSVAYVQEHRESGTVIVPHMSCFWRPG